MRWCTSDLRWNSPGASGWLELDALPFAPPRPTSSEDDAEPLGLALAAPPSSSEAEADTYAELDDPPAPAPHALQLTPPHPGPLVKNLTQAFSSFFTSYFVNSSSGYLPEEKRPPGRLTSPDSDVIAGFLEAPKRPMLKILFLYLLLLACFTF